MNRDLRWEVAMIRKKHHRHFAWLFLAGLLCAFSVRPLWAATYYVATNGNDSHPGTQGQPWKTIQKAADTMVAGDTTRVNEGDYGGDVSVFKKVIITRSGVSGNPITFQAVGNVLTQGFLVQADFIAIKGFEVEDPHDDRVRSATEPDYHGGVGIYVEGSHNSIEDNYIHGCVWGGITLMKLGNFLLPTDNVVKSNRVFRNGMQGIEVAGRNNLIEGNDISYTIQHHPGNIYSSSAGWLDADGMRFFGSGHVIRNNHIHDIFFGAPGINLDPADPNNLYNLHNDYNDDPHIDCFQTWASTDVETASDIIFEQNVCDLLISQAANENGHGFMLAGGAHHLTIRNNIIKAYGGVNTGGSGNAHHLFLYNNVWVNDLSFDQFWPNALGLAEAPYSIVKNNIFYDQPYHTLSVTGDNTGQEIDHNLAYNSDGSTPDCYRINYVCVSPAPAHHLWAIDPKFVDPVNDDYHLRSGSPAIDSGVPIAVVSNDKDGVPRPQGLGYDIGAYEFRTIPLTHTITVTPGDDGTIKPAGDVVVADGANKRFTITPASHYHVGDVFVDGGSVYDQLTWDTVNKKIAYYKFVGVTANHTIEASFAIDTKTLTVSKSGMGSGTVTSDLAGIDCGVDCSEAYDYGTPVVLTAAPDLGTAFQGWLVGGTLVSKTSTYPVTMNKKRSVVAKFLKTYSLNVSAAGDGTGGILVTLVSGKDFGFDVYKAGSIVTVKATPASGSSFAGWSGDASGTAKKITVTMNANKNITATFNPNYAGWLHTGGDLIKDADAGMILSGR
jgi:uncharacterized repeat protein (TIGR02543 family)